MTKHCKKQMTLKWFSCWIPLLQLVTGIEVSVVNVFPDYKLRTLSSRSKISGIWKLATSNYQQIQVRAYTDAQASLIQRNCLPVNISILVNDNSPALPPILRANEIDQLYDENPALYNFTLHLDELNVSDNSTNEQIATLDISSSNNKSETIFVTSWYEEESLSDLPIGLRIERKFGISTICRPKIQINLTRSDESGNDSNDPAAGYDAENETDLAGYIGLSKKTIKEHNVMFYVDSRDNVTLITNCSADLVLRYHFHIDADAESGGVLAMTLLGADASLCLSQSNAPCDKQYGLKSNQSFFVPQPRGGAWKVDLDQFICAKNSTFSFNVTLTGCVDSCGSYDGRGNCESYYTSGHVIMSTCICKAGYNGISCSNAENAMSVSLQLLELLLLTLSNLFFLPAIIIGLYRRYWQETVVYIIAMGVSTVYHACDQSSTQKFYCLANYDTLQYADFLAATAAIWVTVLAIADLPSRWSSILHSTGIMCFAVGAHQNRYSIWLYAAPIIVGFVILLTHWIYQCRIRRDCYPNARMWLCHLIPGFTLALSGFLVKILFEVENGVPSNYYWTHTLWHAFLGLSCAFLLPDVASDATKLYNSNSNNLISYYKSFDEPNFEPNDL